MPWVPRWRKRTTRTLVKTLGGDNQAKRETPELRMAPVVAESEESVMRWKHQYVKISILEVQAG